MNVINALESKTTTLEKEIFLSQLHDEMLSDLWLVYGRIGYATREEKIMLIARCGKTRAEKIEAVKKALSSAKNAKKLFAWLGDTQYLAIWSRVYKHMKEWKGAF